MADGMARALIVQLARLGDLLQTVPAIAALKDAEPDLDLDLLCPSSLAPVGRLLPQIERVLEWDGAQWQRQAQAAGNVFRPEHVLDAERRLRSSVADRYDRVYVLNQHPRALLAGALLGEETIGPRFDTFDEHLTPWAAYIRRVATTGISHRVHLADAFCGLCRVRPTGQAIAVRQPDASLRADLAEIGGGDGPWVGLIVGAGDALRFVPIGVWQAWIARYIGVMPEGRVVLLGDKQECERAQQIQDGLPSSVLGRVWDLTGRTSLIELASVLGRCRCVVGADTGPLHLAAAVGAQVVGWYFARARVHETGPYGTGHVVWQADGVRNHLRKAPAGSFGQMVPDPIVPSKWPIDATVAYLAGRAVPSAEGWTMWHSRCDRWGAYFTGSHGDSLPPAIRERTWRLLHPAHI